MKLADYLTDRNIKPADFGTQIGVSYEAVRRYCVGQRIPDRKTMALIFSATQGAVTADDFFGLEAVSHQAAAPSEGEAA